MKKSLTSLLFFALLISFAALVSCGEDGFGSCTGCPDDAPYGAKGGDCYATLSACESNESGSCGICQ
ncbi:MAG: hypothetical protein CMB80_34030 [Flammeovirgaceae bacterium]|nr:hypothetical protein [Flammeovirgaceae bacterium]MBR11452.1 hypothetical protein [Rickettsiales bacterium]HCX24202.1 hypothetical protein [Cytophagales bacterium]|tara:strand:- start:4441 stop:4641 length:201 start_codon:yes stop_codon:yes gene_type:complete